VSQHARTSPRSTGRRGRDLAAIVLAAGKGTRMNSTRAKVLHEILGVPMVSYPIRRALELRASPLAVVLGHQRAEVERVLAALHGRDAFTVVEQRAARGTGDAVRLALPLLGRAAGLVLILVGDAPLVEARTLARLLATARRTGGLAFLTATVGDATGYGRVVRDARGRVTGVVEHRDAIREERAIREINAAIYAAPAPFLRRAVARLGTANAQREYYLPDIVAAAARGIGAHAVEVDAAEVAGVNDRAQLAGAERALGRRLIASHMARATFRDPDTVRVEADVAIAPDAEIGRFVSLRGHTRIARGARIGDGCILDRAEVGEGAHVLPYCVIEGASIAAGARVGPFARLRPGTQVGPGAHVGNFVETKKTVIGRGSKANHLTYLGDATIGAGVNVGAGTITCNYDGLAKHETVIDDGAFIGSDTQLVAPVRVGRRAVVAAGTTVTGDVPAGALAIARTPQKNVPGYAIRLAVRRAGKQSR